MEFSAMNQLIKSRPTIDREIKERPVPNIVLNRKIMYAMIGSEMMPGESVHHHRIIKMLIIR